MLISIIIPCRNEEKRLGKTLDAVKEYLAAQPYDSEILVVDNGSTDGTRKLVLEYSKKMPALSLVEENSHGKGWAVKQGMLRAKGDYRLFTDADNSTDIAELGKMLAVAESGYDVVVSSRRIEGSKIIYPQPWHRRMLGTAFAYVVGIIVPTGVKDTQNGFKLFSKRAAEKIFPHQTIYYWAFDVEILALTKKFKFKMKEVPITWVNDDRSGMSLRGMIRMIFEVLLTRMHLMIGKYR